MIEEIWSIRYGGTLVAAARVFLCFFGNALALMKMQPSITGKWAIFEICP